MDILFLVLGQLIIRGIDPKNVSRKSTCPPFYYSKNPIPSNKIAFHLSWPEYIEEANILEEIDAGRAGMQ